MYLVVHFIWVQPQHMKYNGQIYFVFIYYYNHFLEKIANLYLYVIKRSIGFVHNSPEVVAVFSCVFKMRSLHGRLLWQSAWHICLVLFLFFSFCSATVKFTSLSPEKKKVDNPLC